MPYVYAYYKPDAELPFYIGKGVGPRAYAHMNPCELARPDRFHCTLRAMLQRGEAPIVHILADELSDENAINLEIQLIAFYGRLDQGTGCLCNHTDGGEGQAGRIMSQETRDKIAQSKRGGTHSDETREKMSQAHMGKTWSQESIDKRVETRIERYSQAFESYNLDTNETIKKYESFQKLGSKRSNVIAVLNGRRQHAYGKGWRYC